MEYVIPLHIMQLHATCTCILMVALVALAKHNNMHACAWTYACEELAIIIMIPYSGKLQGRKLSRIGRKGAFHRMLN